MHSQKYLVAQKSAAKTARNQHIAHLLQLRSSPLYWKTPQQKKLECKRGTTFFTVSSKSPRNMHKRMYEVEKWEIKQLQNLELSGVEHCTVYTIPASQNTKETKRRETKTKKANMEVWGVEVHMSTWLQMWGDVFWRRSSFPCQLTLNLYPDLYLYFNF